MEIYAIIKKNVVLGGFYLKSLKKEHFCYGAILSAIGDRGTCQFVTFPRKSKGVEFFLSALFLFYFIIIFT